MFLLVWYFFRPLLSNVLICLFANKTPLCYSLSEGKLLMKELKKLIDQAKIACLSAIKEAESAEQLEAVRIQYLGRQGTLVDLMKSIKDLSLDEKREIGPLLNTLKNELTAQFEEKLSTIDTQKSPRELFDVTAYKPHQLYGSLHIFTHIIEELNGIFSSMGYTILDGPEVETDYYNFKSLNIPDDHPARDSHDTFWLSNPGHLLRTHTSTTQAHAMENNKPPLAVFAPGRCYRNEAVDASHDFMFMQAEGLMIDENISVSNLLATAQVFLKALFETDKLNIRVRPGYFPFVEPGLEIDASCPFCKKGCSICKKTGWIELLGAGLVHPNVLKHSKIDPKKYSGFAFGFGIERIAMIKYGINDIRLFRSNNIAFLKQF